MMLPFAAAAVLWALVVVGAEGAWTSTCTGTGAEVYDHWPPTESQFLLEIQNDPDCLPAPQGYAVEIAQLFTPKKVPWRYTSVCLFVTSGDGAVTEPLNGTLRILPVDRSTWTPQTAAAPLHEEQLSLSWPYGVSDTTDFSTSIDIFEPEVFVSVKLKSCSMFYITFSTDKFLPTQLSFFRQLETDPWQQFTTGSAFVLRTLGGDTSEVPSSWGCPVGKYASGDKCDCECGAWDPDCADTSLASTCSSGEICTHDAVCVEPSGWGLTPQCTVSHYGVHDGCHCCPGVPDPDCNDPTQIDMCGDVPSATCAAGVCTKAWTCNASKFGDGICDCEACGALDIDCLTIANPTTCNNNENECSTENTCWIPRAWTCTANKFADGVYCDCCGGWDTDCANYSAPLRSCSPPSNECTPDGQCIVAGCNNGNLDVRAISEECDGGIGCSTAFCECDTGYEPFSPYQAGCKPICNDSHVSPPEECDGGLFCTNCVCDPGHPAYSTPRKFCKGCGNSIVDLDLFEECDSGVGCNNITCVCLPGYVPFGERMRDCQLYVSEESSSMPEVVSGSTHSTAFIGASSSAAGGGGSGGDADRSSTGNLHSSSTPGGGGLSLAGILAIVGVLVAAVVAGAIIAAVLLIKKKQKKNKQLYSAAEASELAFLPDRASAPVLRHFEAADKDFGLALTPGSLEFGELKVDETASKTIILRNRLDRPTEVFFSAPSDPYHAVIVMDPIALDLGPAGSKSASSEVRLTLTLKCSFRLANGLRVTNGRVGYTTIPLTAQGAPSRMIDPDDIPTDANAILATDADYIASKAKWEGCDVLLKEVQHAVTPEMLAAFRADIEMCASFRSPNLAPVLFSGATAMRTILLVELAPMGTLDKLVATMSKRLETRTQVKFALDCARGMNALHEREILHGVLRPSNMLVFSTHPDADICIKVADWGSSGLLHRMPLTPQTLLFVAPELMLDSSIPPSRASDVYAFGFSLFFMADTPGFVRRVGMPPETLAVTRTTNLGPLHDIIITTTSADPSSRGTFPGIIKGIKEAIAAMPATLSEMPIK